MFRSNHPGYWSWKAARARRKEENIGVNIDNYADMDD
jgi:hypothetical protein